MAMITFLGGEETGNVGSVKWGNYTFELNKAVECNDPEIVKKAMSNPFFAVGGTQPPPPLDIPNIPKTEVKRLPGRPPKKVQAEAMHKPAAKPDYSTAGHASEPRRTTGLYHDGDDDK